MPIKLDALIIDNFKADIYTYCGGRKLSNIETSYLF